MKDFFKLKKPEIIEQAAVAHKGWNLLVELIVFAVVFIIGSLLQTFIIVPVETLMLSQNEAYVVAQEAGDMEQMVAAAQPILASDSYMILTLFSDIALILVAVVFCRVLQGRKLETVGFGKKHIAREYLCGLAAGFLAFSVAVLICVVTGALQIEGISALFSPFTFILFAAGYMIQGMAEEVLCRGYLMVSVARRYPMAVAILANALFFAALHLFNSGISVLAFINLVLFGIFASLYFIKRGNIWGVGAFHSVWNLVQGNFYGIRVSGMETQCTIFSSKLAEGKELWNGGEFGLEGGLAVTIVLLVGIAIMFALKTKETE